MRILFRKFHDTFAANRAARKVSVPDDQAGLTLVEMIVVLAIIALVAALIVPNVINRPDQARVTTAGTDLRSIGGALKMYRLDNGDYPTTEQGLKALVEKPTSPPLPGAYPPDGYLSQMPQDPWGNPYVYESTGGRFAIKSLGKDGKPGGTDLDADIDGQTR
ncbi:type II secretion system major pseudopilin GspG [Sphingomonas sp. CFBP 13720]|jgi:general secretion pathway protein G|uniref:type II secretion system major pseudopilin GspG n=1 Tax=Sphingomonas sp. CFBP 13720 TaxID=2775302 RepID=UPI00177CFB10|nr:type II secretion system major pseudopilin GspG [Sphingomonas sp. CFBP 13720]MBD8678174.1 type II secretion system major pseudopilin GspG [Sphingomonas sp. CFBP 13720]